MNAIPPNAPAVPSPANQASDSAPVPSRAPPRTATWRTAANTFLDGASCGRSTVVNDARLTALIDTIRPRYDNGDPGHDFAHVERVMKSCRRIAETVGAELAIVLPAALLHDVINVPKNHPDRTAASA